MPKKPKPAKVARTSSGLAALAREPAETRKYILGSSRLFALQEDSALGRSHIPPGYAHPLRHRGLSREMRHHDRHRPQGQAPLATGYPGLRHRHVVRRALL